MRFTNDAKHMTLINKLRQANPPVSEILAEIEKDYHVKRARSIRTVVRFKPDLNQKLSLPKTIRVVSLRKKLYSSTTPWKQKLNKGKSTALPARRQPDQVFRWKRSCVHHGKHQSRKRSRQQHSSYLPLPRPKPWTHRRTAHVLGFQGGHCIQYPPKYINVRVENANPDDFVDTTAVPDEVIIPISVLDKGTTHKGFFS